MRKRWGRPSSLYGMYSRAFITVCDGIDVCPRQQLEAY